NTPRHVQAGAGVVEEAAAAVGLVAGHGGADHRQGAVVGDAAARVDRAVARHLDIVEGEGGARAVEDAAALVRRPARDVQVRQADGQVHDAAGGGRDGEQAEVRTRSGPEGDAPIVGADFDAAADVGQGAAQMDRVAGDGRVGGGRDEAAAEVVGAADGV